MLKGRYSNWILVGILAVSFLLLAWGIGGRELVGDEAVYAFRSAGYLDYLGTSFQTQPIEWFKNQPLPWWTSLSFHDAPPLGFAVQNIFFRIFGDFSWVAFLPGLFLGVLSVLLIYLLAKKIFKDEEAALLGAAMFAVNGATVWIFRTSLLEPTLLLFLILNIYCFFLFLEDRRYWWLFGISLGLVSISKYTGFFILPVYFVFLLLRKRGMFRDWRLYCSLALAFLIFLPVVIYNFYLYRTVGHFDLQFAYLFGQKTPEWTGLIGKEENPFWMIGSNLVSVYGLGFLLFSLLGLVYSAYGMIDIYRRKSKLEAWQVFFGLYLIFATLMFGAIGSAPRFIVLYVLPLVLFLVPIVKRVWDYKGWIGRAVVILFLSAQLFLSLNQVSAKAVDYGVVKLDNYFQSEFAGRQSAVIPDSDNPHLSEVIKNFSARQSGKPGFYMLIYNQNLALPTIEWVFYRNFFYHSVPTFYVENFSETLRQEGAKFFNGFDLYFVQGTKDALLDPFKAQEKTGDDFEASLIKKGLKPVKEIYGHDGLLMFKIYKFKVEEIE